MYNSPNSFFQLSTVLCKFLSITVRYTKSPACLYNSPHFSTSLHFSTILCNLYNSLRVHVSTFSTFLYNSLHLSTATSRILQNCLQFSGFPSPHPPTMPQIPPHFHYNSVNSSTIFDIYMSLYNFYNSLHGSTILYIFLEHFSTMLYNFVEFSSPLFFCIVSELYTHLATSLYNSRYVSLHCPTCLDNSLHVSTFFTFLWISLQFVSNYLHFFTCANLFNSLHVSTILQFSSLMSLHVSTILYNSLHVSCLLHVSTILYMSLQFSTFLEISRPTPTGRLPTVSRCRIQRLHGQPTNGIHHGQSAHGQAFPYKSLQFLTCI